MKKPWLVLGIMAAMVIAGVGIATAYAQDNGTSGTPESTLCKEWQLGEIKGEPIDNAISLLPRGGDEEVMIQVDEDTNYRAFMAPWQDISFESLGDGDWIAVRLEDDVAKTVVLLEAPRKPFELMVEGTVTGATANIITASTEDGGSFTVDLSNADIDVDGVEEGQHVRLTIGEYRPCVKRCCAGLHVRRFLRRGPFRLGGGYEGCETMLEWSRQGLEKWLDLFDDQGHDYGVSWLGMRDVCNAAS